MKQWYSATELAALKLNGLPGTDRGIAHKAKREGWGEARQPNRLPAWRRRKGRGGGLEFHVCLLPVKAFNELERRNVGLARHLFRRISRMLGARPR